MIDPRIFYTIYLLIFLSLVFLFITDGLLQRYVQREKINSTVIIIMSILCWTGLIHGLQSIWN
jgi:hypothetical protein